MSAAAPPANQRTLLIVDDEAEHGESLRRLFERQGYRVHLATSGERALDTVRSTEVDVILTDLMMPGLSGQDLLKAARAIRQEVDVIVMTAYGTVENAVAAMREGAYDFVQKPFKSAVVTRVVERAMERQQLARENLMLRTELARVGSSAQIIGRSPAMVETMETVQQAAPSTATVLIYGESGTGKELISKAIHAGSPRAQGPLVVVNCAALPESILEAELFGYEPGAFTGANQRKEGRVERAHGGTLFLDEVGELSPPVQAKLLRLLQEGEIDRLGGREPVKVDFRLVAATNRDLESDVRDGIFREDLYYRLAVIPIHLPPLRERPEDIPLLAEHFARLYADKNDKHLIGMTQEAMEALVSYEWPGNVRELENVIERATVLTREDAIDIKNLPGPVASARGEKSREPIQKQGEKIVIPIGTKLEEVERVLIHETLEKTGGDKSLAAQLLGIAPRTIYRRLEAERTRNKSGGGS